MRTISDSRANALRERETQYLQATKTIADNQQALRDLFNSNPDLARNPTLKRIYDSLSGFPATNAGVSVTIDSAVFVLGDF